MQETEFIAQNKEKWREFEEILKTKEKDPDRLTELFIETTDDLSFAQTFYPNRSVRVYLNNISQKVHQIIYKNKRKSKGNSGKLWRVDIPEALYRGRKEMLLAFLIFMTGIGIGVFSDMYYPEFANVVLSEQYVRMTESYIEEGDPMKVYKDAEALEMFFMISVNNIQISFGAFVLGLFWGIGTLYVLLSNGIMFGAFMHFFFKRGLAQESVLTVMQHGTLELSMIVLSGAAGFMIARGIMFPGSYSRLDSMILAARRAIRIMIPVFILLVYAALIESFLTRFTEIPDIIRVLSILLSLIIVVGYFVWLPFHQHRRGKFDRYPEEEIATQSDPVIQLSVIKNTGQIFHETFDLFSRKFRAFALLSLITGLLVTVGFGFFSRGAYSSLYDFSIFIDFNPLYLIWCWAPYYFFFTSEGPDLQYIMFTVGLAIALFGFHLILSKHLGTHRRKGMPLQLLNALILSAFLNLFLWMSGAGTFFLLIFIWPVCLLLYSGAFENRRFILVEIGRVFHTLRFNFFRTLGVFWTVHGIQWIVLLVLNGAFLFLFAFLLTGRPVNIIFTLLEFVRMNIPRNMDFAAEVPYFLYTLILFFGLVLMISLSTISSALLHYTAREVTTADSLHFNIQSIGKKKRIYGVERE